MSIITIRAFFAVSEIFSKKYLTKREKYVIINNVYVKMG